MPVRVPAAIVAAMLVTLLAAAAVSAGELRVIGVTSFSEAELAEAIALRAPLWPDAAGPWLVTADGPERVVIESRGRRVVVAIGERRGEDAARTVALAMLDLSGSSDTTATSAAGADTTATSAAGADTTATSAAGADTTATSAAGAATGAPSVTALVPAGPGAHPVGADLAAPADADLAATASGPTGHRHPPMGRADLAVSAIVADAVDAPSTGAGVAIGARLRLGGAWYASAGASWLRAPDEAVDQIDVALSTWQLRAGLGRHVANVALAVAPLLAIHQASGVRDTTAAIPGAGATIESRWSIGGRLALVLGAGVDVYAWRDHFTIADTEAAVTPRSAAWVSLGLAMRLAP